VLPVASAPQLVAALATASLHLDGCASYAIRLDANITLADLQQQQPPASPSSSKPSSSSSSSASTSSLAVPGVPFLLPVNVTLRGGQRADSTVLDTALVQSLVALGPGAFLGLEGLTLVNLAVPLPGVMATPLYLLSLPDRYAPALRPLHLCTFMVHTTWGVGVHVLCVVVCTNVLPANTCLGAARAQGIVGVALISDCRYRVGGWLASPMARVGRFLGTWVWESVS
jgi:hypothetical protein